MRKFEGVAVDDSTSYFTYRPLSNLPTPPPTARQPRSTTASYANDDGEALPAIYRGPAIHLVNLIPSTASLASASIHLVQSILGRASLPLETIALAVCVLDRLDAKFGRKWRLTCPLRPGSSEPAAAAAPDATIRRQVFAHTKRHSLPLTPQQPRRTARQPQLHIDSVQPEIIVLAALVIADKFTEDSEQSTQAYCTTWGRGLWSSEQLNATERSIMESLNYRIMPLCADDCLTDAMVDMQLAGQDYRRWDAAEPSPPHSDDGDMSFSGDEGDDCESHEAGNLVYGHSRSKTMVPGSGMRSASIGLGLSWATAI
ncbi:hypothetical protein LMH87_006359 [Akanthomyces muscarius]|uniref:Cyclin n=1 Tax=Akanthomyces muscarius TaxID=2231603 RepID=A0A9W8QQR2_AKAMU|nr:hypothetical protein LMH87_006359 [Akanthomyces muscarius]KAJ4164697.1 hypothetical protein LMH87_006359 [Akanthomyces muscarius]